jgi:cyclic dehypoxanthinyl futalosine synthase
MSLTRQQALDAFHSDDLIGIGMEADAVRRTLHPENVVTYTIDRTLCATALDIDAKLEEAFDLGATSITLRGSLPTLAAWEAHLTRCAALPSHGLTATEITTLAQQANLPAAEILARLQVAGLRSLSGDDAGILHDAVQPTTSRCTVADWLATHRTAHTLGIPTTAFMLFGSGEILEHRIHHLEALRELQSGTGGFTAFTPIAFQPAAAGIPGFEEATAVEYLKTLAISRMILDNIPNLQADWATQGLKVLQMALRFGANDVGSTMPGTAANPESLLTPDGTTEEDLRRVIRGAGFRPVQRDALYRTMYLG